MISESHSQIRPEGLAQFAQAFPRALASCVVADSHETRVARIVSICDGKVSRARLPKEILQQVILVERLSLPNEVPPYRESASQQRIGYTPQFVIIAARLFGRAGVVDVAYNCERDSCSHAGSVRGTTGAPK